jgi:hypothetical protein
MESRKFALICFLLLTPLLLSSCESRGIKCQPLPYQDFSRAMKKTSKDLSYDVGIDDEEKNFSMTRGSETIAEFDSNPGNHYDYLAGNPTILK